MRVCGTLSLCLGMCCVCRQIIIGQVKKKDGGGGEIYKDILENRYGVMAKRETQMES